MKQPPPGRKPRTGKRPAFVPLAGKLVREVALELPASEHAPALAGRFILTVDAEHGLRIRMKGRKRAVSMSFAELVDLGRGDTRQRPKNRKYLAGR